ncbi:inorganic pyrophosphatase [Deinococcus radiopugnans]|uniref:Inorganic pyrophosphatase n=1 Tax=Deinococcus radiopugnans ATCC 19172 TaxID=585398 RepID=A0A5C4XZE0_9DEIO|nr:inorganic pyrophosphatase [Deinococcus radiopugnans]MBB6017881.1 inorganic pyrophosphatase [Deinococcus radiopugnans ATCC 19172]TNM68944.1 inorganic pyrophosphatase [Deinococcus radiopugnans ATCC 19172]
MKPDLRPFLGQRVNVVVDRPLGSAHPRHQDIVYGVNSGELPGTVSGDGHPIDAYLLGWPESVEGVWGTVIAVIVRHDDGEDKLVVARDGTHWTDEEIANATRFQERYFHGTLAR